jgi:hypothetical protein
VGSTCSFSGLDDVNYLFAVIGFMQHRSHEVGLKPQRMLAEQGVRDPKKNKKLDGDAFMTNSDFCTRPCKISRVAYNFDMMSLTKNALPVTNYSNYAQ